MSRVRPSALVQEIVRDLRSHGEFEIRVPEQPLQGLVDVRWAIKTAARFIDRHVETEERRSGEDVVLVASLQQPSTLTA